jgi:hypothetical protein
VEAAAARLSEEAGSAAGAAEVPSGVFPTGGAVAASVSSAEPPGVIQAVPDAGNVAAKEFFRPGPGRRILRGMLWGVLYGQWWTALTIASAFMWGHASLDARLVVFAIDLSFYYGIAGSLTGVVIGAVNASIGTGLAIGVGAGLLLCAREALLSHDPGSLINIVFYFFTGRFVGAGITWRVQQPVRRKSPD